MTKWDENASVWPAKYQYLHTHVHPRDNVHSRQWQSEIKTSQPNLASENTVTDMHPRNNVYATTYKSEDDRVRW